MRRIAIYGGSFDPPHKGHTEIIARLSNIFDRVVVVPAFISPFKQGLIQVSAEDRLYMLRLAIADASAENNCFKEFGGKDNHLKNNIEVSTFEIDKGGVSFTYDTVQHIKAQNQFGGGDQVQTPNNQEWQDELIEEGEPRLYFVTGSESVPTLHLWKNSRLLEKEVTFYVVPREGYPQQVQSAGCPNHARKAFESNSDNAAVGFENGMEQKYLCKTQFGHKAETSGKTEVCAKVNQATETDHAADVSPNVETNQNIETDNKAVKSKGCFRIKTAPFCVADYSSSLFKAAHAFGFSRDLVSKNVYDYINSKGLYREYFPLTAGFVSFALSEGRVLHTYRAVKAGIMLAKIHGESVDKVITALTLHDIAKNTTSAVMLAHGVRPSDTNGIPADCRHAVWGADIARQFYKITDEDILNAIRFHTTGRPAMSRLEMIVALADYVEEGREFFGRAEVFEVAKQNLPAAMADMLTRVMEYLGKTDREIFDVSLKALEYYKGIFK